MKNRINIGVSSIILIFMILCLAVFCLLSLTDAKNALAFSERHADSVCAYYEADAAGQIFLRDYRKNLEQTKDPSTAAREAAVALPEGNTVSVTEDGTVVCEIPMDNGQSMHMEFGESGSGILACYVYNSEDYAIDDDLPVFGEEEFQLFEMEGSE